MANRKMRKPVQKFQNNPPDNSEIPDEVIFIIFWEEGFPFLPIDPCPHIPAPSFDKGARGEPLGRPFGPKVGGASLFACPGCYPPKAEGQGPLSGLDSLPSGECLPCLFTFERGVSCNTPLHDYRGNIK